MLLVGVLFPKGVVSRSLTGGQLPPYDVASCHSGGRRFVQSVSSCHWGVGRVRVYCLFFTPGVCGLLRKLFRFFSQAADFYRAAAPLSPRVVGFCSKKFPFSFERLTFLLQRRLFVSWGLYFSLAGRLFCSLGARYLFLTIGGIFACVVGRGCLFERA